MRVELIETMRGLREIARMSFSIGAGTKWMPASQRYSPMSSRLPSANAHRTGPVITPACCRAIIESVNISEWTARSFRAARPNPTAFAIPPRPSWMVERSSMRSRMWPAMRRSDSVTGGCRYSGSSWSASQIASTAVTWMRLVRPSPCTRGW